MLALLGLLLIVGGGGFVCHRCWKQEPRCTEDVIMAFIAGFTTVVCVLVLVLV
jgi:hypothetical protein